RIARALGLRGFSVTSVGSAAEARARTARPPAFAVLDLRLGDGNGLELVQPLRQARPDIRIVVLTGYGNIATAVAAVKEGAVDYLAKPADADAIEQALIAHGRKLPPPPSNPMSADRVRWEHIQRVFEQCDRNVSETARSPWLRPPGPACPDRCCCRWSHLRSALRACSRRASRSCLSRSGRLRRHSSPPSRSPPSSSRVSPSRWAPRRARRRLLPAAARSRSRASRSAASRSPLSRWARCWWPRYGSCS